MKKNILFALIIFMMAQMLFAGGKGRDSSEKDIRIILSEKICKLFPGDRKPLKKETVLKFADYISNEFVNGITNVQYNNIIKMFSLDNLPVDESSSFEEKKFILAYYLLEKYRSRDYGYLYPTDYLKDDKVTGISETKISSGSYSKVNCILISWINENDNWYIAGMKYSEDSILQVREKIYNFNKDHISKIVIAQRPEELVILGVTCPVPFTEENYDVYYPGGYIRGKGGKNIYFTGGFSWQLTDKANYFFADGGAEVRFNVFFGEKFSISPELTALAKLNLVTSDPSAGITGEGGFTFHFINDGGKDFFAIKPFYQHSFIFPFRKESDSFNLGTVGLAVHFKFD